MTRLPSFEQYADMCGSLSREVILFDRESTINGVKAPFFTANHYWVCSTWFVQYFIGIYALKEGHLLLCLAPAVRRLPLTFLQETPEHLLYMDV